MITRNTSIHATIQMWTIANAFAGKLRCIHVSFPFPFEDNTYAYSNNLKPLGDQCAIAITEDYQTEVERKRDLLTQRHRDCFQAMPGTSDGQWEVLHTLLAHLTKHYPSYFTVSMNGNQTTFVNHILGESQTFEYGNTASLPFAPLDFIGRHVQEDLILMGQREDELYLDAGQLCFPGNWSIAFDLGMRFSEIHRPVPVIGDSELGHKIEKFLLRTTAETPWTRLNWSLNAGRRLDTSPSTFDEWGPLRYEVKRENAGRFVHLRVESQNLIRLTGQHNILFTIHTFLMPLEKLIENPLWAHRLHGVLTTLSDEMTEYKGLSAYKAQVITYLEDVLCR